MRASIAAAVFLSVSLLTNAQQTEYGQCGGMGYTGPTSCVSPFVCESGNAYYYQCLPASTGITTSPSTSKSSHTAFSTTSSHTTTATSPTNTPSGGTTQTGQYSCTTSGNWILCDDYWNMYGCNGGSQSTTLYSTSGKTISWSTTYNWQNCGTTPASYSNAEPTIGEGVVLSTVTSIPTTWSWEYMNPSSNLAADVSYDMWLGKTPNAAASSSGSSYEIMIWLGKNGSIQPIGSQIASGITVGGYTWDLWEGPNGNFQTYSFVTTGANIESFSADLLPFFTYLVSHYGVSTSLYLQHIQSGTEPFQGSATLYTTSYSLTINS